MSQSVKEALLAATEIRVLFAFDVRRKAILLVGGDKSSDWSGWYKENIPIADDRFDDHLEKVRGQLAKTKSGKPAREKRKGKQ